MRFSGQVCKAGNWWAIEVPLLGAYSQARSKPGAFRRIKAAVEELMNTPGFSVDVHPGKAGYFEVGSNDEATFIAFFLRQRRGVRQ